jgi:hypothetical protein
MLIIILIVLIIVIGSAGYDMGQVSVITMAELLTRLGAIVVDLI